MGPAKWRSRAAALDKLAPMRPLAAEDELALIARAQDGDRLAFEELVRRHADRLYAVVLRFLADADQAEEVTQESFLRAWRGIGGFRGKSSFFTWLYRIGINEAKRRAGRRPPEAPAISVEDEPIEHAPDWSEAPEVRQAEGEVLEVLEAAIRGLPAGYRLPLILRDLDGLSTKEAAEVLGLGEAAFKSRLHRARLVVRRAIDEYFLEAE
ncbi:MAG: sigma-70 family RNA polymerase sigma factor [Chloroflexota bacterium]|nr:sigma-70 family RNA polymerase sigma factor [Chloroflexota bacterium]MDQ2939751.1 sigma-70 family RNA polymerase sigma factor [Actinomycetota bacterium]